MALKNKREAARDQLVAGLSVESLTQYLRGHNLDEHTGARVLSRAVKSQQPDVVKLALRQGVSPNIPIEYRDRLSSTHRGRVLDLAIQNGDIATVTHLIEYGVDLMGLIPCHPFTEGALRLQPPLWHAVTQRDLKMAAVLLVGKVDCGPIIDAMPTFTEEERHVWGNLIGIVDESIAAALEAVALSLQIPSQPLFTALNPISTIVLVRRKPMPLLRYALTADETLDDQMLLDFDRLKEELAVAHYMVGRCGEPTLTTGLPCRRRVKYGGPCFQHHRWFGLYTWKHTAEAI